MIKKGKKITITISYRLQFIDSARFMASSLSNPINNLAEGIHKINVNMDLVIKNLKLAELNTKTATAVMNAQTLKMI